VLGFQGHKSSKDCQHDVATNDLCKVKRAKGLSCRRFPQATNKDKEVKHVVW